MRIANVSVITPCHNAASFIGETIQSVGTQTLRPKELIVIDDASNDDSAKIANATGSSLGLDVTVIKVDCRNAAAARNAGLRISSGEWIAFLDADDIWYPNHIENAVTQLSTSQDVAYMANHRWLRGGEIEDIPESLRPKINETLSGLKSTKFTDLMSLGFHFGHSTVLYRRDRVQQVGGFDESQQRRHDIDLWLRVLAAKTWSWGAEPAACYRIDTPGSISKNVIEAEYYYLKALLRNAAAYKGPSMQSLVQTCARRATSLAFTDGSWDQYQLVKPLAWPYLSSGFKCSYAIAEYWPTPLRQAIRIKRRLISLGRSNG